MKRNDRKIVAEIHETLVISLIKVVYSRRNTTLNFRIYLVCVAYASRNGLHKNEQERIIKLCQANIDPDKLRLEVLLRSE